MRIRVAYGAERDQVLSGVVTRVATELFAVYLENGLLLLRVAFVSFMPILRGPELG